ncbi:MULTISPECIES: DUF6351 family protein [unclassified Streptomyces]|uniref:DUF6351 family protein n=1 Tax=unclassified Streptomyces TaxID=2593676 RepID=UPI00093B49FF|nr:DUF6351 family protein [Streptomyces sp. TSRI0281]
MRFHSFSTRARLDKANGTHANQVMLTRSSGHGFTLAGMLSDMDQWLTGIKGDSGTDAQFEDLQSIFRTGVCDWSVPWAGQQGIAGTWESFDPK